MKLVVTAVDQRSELDGQVPLVIDLIGRVAGADRPDYWLGRPRRSIVWQSRSGPREIDLVTVAARHEGRPIVRGARGVLVGLGYVLDPGAISADRVTCVEFTMPRLRLST